MSGGGFGPDRTAQEGWSRFLDAVGHELRTPLTAILGYQELLEEGVYGQLEPKGAEAVRRVGAAAHELLSLLNGMIDLGRPDGQPPELDIAPVPLTGLLREVAASGQRLGPERGVDWSDDVPDDLPIVTSDPNRLQRALFLAVLAAIRATPGGAIRMSVAPEDDGATIRLHGVGFQDLPEPPLADLVLRRAEDDTERSVLRMAVALHGLRRLGGSWTLETGGTATLALRIRPAPHDPPRAPSR